MKCTVGIYLVLVSSFLLISKLVASDETDRGDPDKPLPPIDAGTLLGNSLYISVTYYFAFNDDSWDLIYKSSALKEKIYAYAKRFANAPYKYCIHFHESEHIGTVGLSIIVLWDIDMSPMHKKFQDIVSYYLPVDNDRI